MNRRSLAFGAIGLCVFLAIASLASARPISLHLDSVVSFTSTGDFDAGVKNQPSPADGNLNVETITDNPGISTGAIELASLKGDNFNTADADGDTFKWDVAAFGNGGSACTRSIASGVLHLGYAGTSRKVCVNQGSATISGNWDVRVHYDVSVDPGETVAQYASLCLLDTKDHCEGSQAAMNVADDGVAYQYLEQFHQFNAFTVTGGTPTQVGSTSIATVDAGCLRITKSATTITFYRAGDCSSWIQDEQTTFTVPANIYPIIDFSTGGSQSSGSAGTDFDSFNVASGTVDSAGYRAAGNWTSASQTYTSDIVQKIMVNYTLSAAGSPAIDYVKIVKASDGTVLYVDNTDIVAGTTHSYTVPSSDLLKVNWKVVIGLKGSGVGTPTITNVDVTAGAPPAPPNPITETIGLATSAVAALLVVMGVIIAFICIYLVLFSVKDRFLDPSVYKRGKS